jgi:hypothetical protein
MSRAVTRETTEGRRQVTAYKRSVTQSHEGGRPLQGIALRIGV